MFSFLPEKFSAPLCHADYNKVYEIRLRVNRPVIVNYNMQKLYLTGSGLSVCNKYAICISQIELEEIVLNFCERSIYAYTDKIRRGFITLQNGIRVGLCGECVIENDKIINIKNISSLNIRLPHSVKGCSNKIFALYNGEIANTLIISPPGAGKTTLIRDLAEKISEVFKEDILICDERNEICPLITSSETIDSITFGSKLYAFENGIRSMSPKIVVTDEIISKNDAFAILFAKRCGIKVLATAHGADICDVFCNDDFSVLKNVFDLCVVLDDNNGKGNIKKIYRKSKDIWLENEF